MVANAPKGETRWRGQAFSSPRGGCFEARFRDFETAERGLTSSCGGAVPDLGAGSGCRDMRMALPICRWGTWRLMVKYRWMPRSRSSRGPFHRNWLMADNRFMQNPFGRQACRPFLSWFSIVYGHKSSHMTRHGKALKITPGIWGSSFVSIPGWAGPGRWGSAGAGFSGPAS